MGLGGGAGWMVKGGSWAWYPYGGVGPIAGRPEEEYRHQLGRYGISGELAVRPVASLSGGQKSRVAFAQMTMPW